MPRLSQRQQLLREVREKVMLNIALQSSGDGGDRSSRSGSNSDHLKLSESDSDYIWYSSNDSEDETDVMELESAQDDILELYAIMESTRFFNHKQMTNKSKDFIVNFFDQLPPLIFRQMTRMDKSSFFGLVTLIQNHRVFSSNSFNEQAPTEWQLAVTLDRLGHNGNGSCLNRMIPTWGVSVGSLCNFTNRVFVALEDALKNQVKWPNRAERRSISSKFAQKGFPGCVGLIDGTLIPLTQRSKESGECSKESGECYFDRKSRYSINAQVVCVHRRKILYLFTGMPGSCSDLTCWQKCYLYRLQSLGTFFSKNQFLLGDSGYESSGPQASRHMVTAYRRSDQNQDKEDFNNAVAKCRVTNEHCIGVLKSRWHSLKEMRVQLKGKKDNKFMVRWIILCAKLHNFVISQNDMWTDEDEEILYESSDDEYDHHPSNLPGVARRATANSSLQALVVEYALRFHRQPSN